MTVRSDAKTPEGTGVGCLDPMTGLVLGVQLTENDPSEARVTRPGIRSCLVFAFDDDKELAEIRELMTKVRRVL